MKNLIIVLTVVLSLALAGNVLAGTFEDAEWFYHTNTGAIKNFDKHPGEPSQWVPCPVQSDVCFEPDPDPDPDPTGCEGDCYSDWYTEGYSEQFTGVNFQKGTIKVKNNGNVVGNGAIGFAQEGSNAGYWAEDCDEGCYGSGAIGGAITVGGSSLWGGNNADSAWVAGLTGSGSVAFLLGSNAQGEVFVEGSGEMGTFAQKEKGNTYAGASSYGNYMYEASAGGSGTGLIGVGGLGLTGGGSYVHNGGNNVSAVSGQVTISAAGAIGLNFDRPQ